MATQQDLRNEMEALRVQRGAATLDRKPFDGRRLKALETELAAHEDAEAESARRAHQAHEKAARERRKEAVQRIIELNGKRLAALERAETAGREMAAALKEVFDTSHGILDAAAGVDGVQAPFVLEQRTTERRLGQCVLALVQPLGQARSAFGDLRFRLPDAAASGSWVEFDRKATGPIMGILTSERNFQ